MSEDQRAQDQYGLLPEPARRYYLNAMGIQCWESLDEPTSEPSLILTADITRFQSLETEIQQCNKCLLHKTRRQAVAGQGDKSAELMFIFMSPDKNDDESGVLCSGEALSLFEKMLTAINISIDDVFITSLLKCTVPEHHTVSMTEISLCKDYLKQQVQLVQPRLIVVLGDTAARCLLQKDASLDELRDVVNIKKPIDSTLFESVPLLISYSPHELLRSPKNKRKSWADLQQIQKLIEN